eukprot:139834_1
MSGNKVTVDKLEVKNGPGIVMKSDKTPPSRNFDSIEELRTYRARKKLEQKHRRNLTRPLNRSPYAAPTPCIASNSLSAPVTATFHRYRTVPIANVSPLTSHSYAVPMTPLLRQTEENPCNFAPVTPVEHHRSRAHFRSYGPYPRATAPVPHYGPYPSQTVCQSYYPHGTSQVQQTYYSNYVLVIQNVYSITGTPS